MPNTVEKFLKRGIQMSKIRRIICVLLAACMLFCLAGCGDTRWICEVDGNEIPAGVYIYYQTEGYGDALTQLVQEDSDTYLYPYIYYYNYGMVETALFDTKLSSGETVEEHINAYALDMCKQLTIVDKLFDQLGLELTEDEKALLDSQTKSVWSNSGEGLEEIGVSEASYKMVLLSKIKEERVFDAYYEVGGKNGTTEEEIKDYYSDNYARIKYMTFTFSDSADDAVDETRKNEQLELANSYLDELNAGASMDELIERHNEELAAETETDTEDGAADTDDAVETEDDAAEPETSDDETDTEETGDESAETENEYPNESILSKDSVYPTEKFVNYVFTTVKVGENAVVQDDTCFYVVQRLDVNERTDLYDSNRNTIIKDLFDDDYTKLINEELAKYTVNVNNSSIKKYKTKNAFPDATAAE